MLEPITVSAGRRQFIRSSNLIDDHATKLSSIDLQSRHCLYCLCRLGLLPAVLEKAYQDPYKYSLFLVPHIMIGLCLVQACLHTAGAWP